MMFVAALYVRWFSYFVALGGVRLQLYTDDLKCVSSDCASLLRAARFTGYVRIVGQEIAPSKCVLLSTSREVRKDI